jgi:hypothetical protein
MRTKRECYSCGARDGEAEFPERKGYRKRRVCCGCLAEMDRPLGGDRIARPMLLTRASWRALERARAASPQMDLIDWLSA